MTPTFSVGVISPRGAVMANSIALRPGQYSGRAVLNQGEVKRTRNSSRAEFHKPGTILSPSDAAN
jgi:hypothetical protein